MKLNIKFDSNEDKLIVEPIGDIDIHNSEEFKKSVLESFREKDKDILIDGSNLGYIDSTGLGAFIYIYKHVKDEGNKVYLENLKPNILKLLKITELDKVFIIRGVSDNE